MNAVERIDSWVSTLLSLGQGPRDRTAFRMAPGTDLTDEELDALYREDPYAQRIVNHVPEDALRRGVDIVTGDSAVDTAVKAKLDELWALPRVDRAWCWGRLWGGGALLLGADDGRPPDQPLALNSLRSLTFVADLDKRALAPVEWNQDPLSAGYGDPTMYRMTRRGRSARGSVLVHASRLIIFAGATTTEERRAVLGGWWDSVLVVVYRTLMQTNGAWEASAALLHDVSQGVLHIKGLAAMMTSDGEGLVKARLRLIELMRSVARTMLLDVEEKYLRTEANLTGLPDVLDRFVRRLAGAVPMPVTLLMGQAPAGLNATGDSDIRAHYDRVEAHREIYLRPRLERLVRVILRAQDGPTRGVEPAAWRVEFPPLWQSTEKETADLRRVVADTDVAYVAAGVLTPEEVAVSRFREDGYSSETSIELDNRELPVAAPTDGQAGEAAPKEGVVPQAQTPLTREQSALALEIVQQVAEQKIPRETGLELLELSLPITDQRAASLMGDVGDTWFAGAEDQAGPEAQGQGQLAPGGDVPSPDVPADQAGEDWLRSGAGE